MCWHFTPWQSHTHTSYKQRLSYWDKEILSCYSIQAWGYLKDVERLKLDIGTFISQQVHHELEVLRLADVPRHHSEVVSVQQELTQQLSHKLMHVGCKHSKSEQVVVSYNALQTTYLQWLPLCHIVFRVQQLLIVLKDLQTKVFNQPIKRKDFSPLKMNLERVISQHFYAYWKNSDPCQTNSPGLPFRQTTCYSQKATHNPNL